MPFLCDVFLSFVRLPNMFASSSLQMYIDLCTCMDGKERQRKSSDKNKYFHLCAKVWRILWVKWLRCEKCYGKRQKSDALAGAASRVLVAATGEWFCEKMIYVKCHWCHYNFFVSIKAERASGRDGEPAKQQVRKVVWCVVVVFLSIYSNTHIFQFTFFPNSAQMHLFALLFRVLFHSIRTCSLDVCWLRPNCEMVAFFGCCCFLFYTFAKFY